MGRTPNFMEGGLVVAVAGITLLAICYYAKFLLFHKGKRSLCAPPGPPPWPVIGHLHLLDANRPLHRTLFHLGRTYGHIMLLKFGFRKVLLVSSWELARECLTTHDMNFASRPRSAGFKLLGYDYKLLGQDPYDRRCRNLRRICTLHLLSPSMVEASVNIRTEEMSKVVRGLFHRCRQMAGLKDSEGSAVVNVRSLMVELVFDIMARLILGHRSYLGSAEDIEEFKEMITVTTAELLGAFNLGDYIPFLRWLDLQGCERAMKRSFRRRDELLQRVIDNRRRCIKEENESLIDVLIHLVENAEDFCSDDTIAKATATSMIIAATDTYANTTEWAMATLLQRPDVRKRAQEELDFVVGSERVLEESDLPNLKYLEAVVKETLRLYPAAPLLLPHMAAVPCTVGGYYVPAGTELLLNAWAIHRDPAAWERPLEFEPERFMMSSSPDVNGHGFKYIPFGYGRRACPGMLLAMRILLLTVGRLMQSFEWSIREGMEGIDMNEGRSLTLHKAVPLEAAIKPRLPHNLY